MIRIYTVFSLLNKIPLTDRQWLGKDSAGFRGTVERCPHCGANGCLKEFEHYGRYLIELESDDGCADDRGIAGKDGDRYGGDPCGGE